MEATYASKGVANAGLVTGIVGSALGLMGNNVASGLLGNGINGGNVSKESFELQNKLSASEVSNALLSSELNTERKMSVLREELGGQIRSVEDKVNANAAAQSVINCGFTSADAVLQSQVSQLMGLTKLGIPNGSLMPGYGNVTVTPSIATTT